MCVIPDMALHVRLDQLERLKYGVVSSIQSNILSCLTFLYYLSFLVFLKSIITVLIMCLCMPGLRTVHRDEDTCRD